MSSKCFLPAGWRPLAFAAVLLLCIPHSVSGQIPNLTDTQTPVRALNPPTRGRRPAGKGPAPSPKRVPGTAPEDKQESIEQAIAEGNSARDRNEYKQALTYYRKVSEELDPKEPRGFYGMGNVYADLYCYDPAVAAYRRALELKKDYVEALVGMGYAYIGKESYDDAQEKFQAVLDIKRNYVDANIGLGIVYAKKGEYQKAIKQIDLVVDNKSVRDKDRAAAYAALGDVYWQQGYATKWEWQKIIEQYEKAKSADPSFARAYVSLGVAKMIAAFDEFASVSLRESTVQNRGRLAAAAKEATGIIEEAVNEHGYSRADADLHIGSGLTYQARYRDAVGKINSYLGKVAALKKQMSDMDTNMAAKCGYGFGQLLATGHWRLGFARTQESSHEADYRRKAELLDEATFHFKQAIELKEDYAIAYSQLGLVYYRQSKYDDAVKQYNNALIHTKDEAGKAQLHESIKIAYFLKGRHEDKQGRYDAAIEAYTKAIPYATKEADKAALYENVGLVYVSLRRFDDALSNVQEAIRRDPKNPSFYESLALIHVSQGDLENTFKWLKKAEEVRTTPSTNPDPYYYLGATYAMRFLRQGGEDDFNEAVRWLKKAVEIRRNYTDAYYALGAVYQAHANPDEALASYEKAAQYDPKDPTTYMMLGQGYLDLKQNAEAAIQYFRRTIELKPDYAEAHWRLGLAHHHKKDYAEAAREILEAIKYAPKDLQAYLALASVYKDQKNYAEAIQYLKKATGVAPKDFRPHKELAKIYEEQKRNDDAIRSYEEAISLLDAEYSWFAWTKNLYLGRIERLRGRYAEAIAYFQKLPQPPAELPGQTLYEIGLTHVAGKNKRAALEQYQQLVRLKSPLADELRNKIDEMK